MITIVTNNAEITTNFDTNQIPPNYRFTKDKGKNGLCVMCFENLGVQNGLCIGTFRSVIGIKNL